MRATITKSLGENRYQVRLKYEAAAARVELERIAAMLTAIAERMPTLQEARDNAAAALQENVDETSAAIEAYRDCVNAAEERPASAEDCDAEYANDITTARSNLRSAQSVLRSIQEQIDAIEEAMETATGAELAALQDELDALNEQRSIYLIAVDNRQAELSALIRARSECMQSIWSAEETVRKCEETHGAGLIELNHQGEALARAVQEWDAQLQREQVVTDGLILRQTELQAEVAKAEADGTDPENPGVVLTVNAAHCLPEEAQLEPDTVVHLIWIPDETGGDLPRRLIVEESEALPEHTQHCLYDSATLESRSLLINSALAPGVARWRPTYRLGLVDAVNDDGTLDVFIVWSESVQRLGVDHLEPGIYPQADLNPPETELANVPIAHCSASYYAVGDLVVLRFKGRDWTQPEVFGWADGPVCCWDGLMEHGWYAGALSLASERPPESMPDDNGQYPPTGRYVALDNNLAAYYQGAGGNTEGPVVGRYEWQEREVIDPVTEAVTVERYPAWLETPDVLADNLHRAEIARATHGGLSGIPTGLCLALAQAKRGAGLSVAQLLPPFFLPNWTNIGIQRDGDHDYWLFAAASNGLWGIKLFLEDDSRELRDWLVDNAGNLSQHERLKVEAYVLAGLQLAVPESQQYYDDEGRPAIPQDPADRVVQLLTAAEMFPAYYRNGQLYTALAHGWHWRWQRDDDTAGAVRTACRYDLETDHWYSITAEIDLVWTAEGESGGSWAAWISTQRSGGWGQTTLAFVRVPVSEGLETEPLLPRGAVGAVGAAVYSYMTPSGPQYLRTQSIDWGGSSSVPAPTDEEKTIWGVGAINLKWGTKSTIGSGGWSCAGAQVRTEVATSKEWNTLSASISGGSSYSGSTTKTDDGWTPHASFLWSYFYLPASTRLPGSPPLTQSGWAMYTWGLTEDSAQWTFTAGGASKSTSYEKLSNGNGGSVAVLVGEHTGVTIISGQLGTGYRRRAASGTYSGDHPRLISAQDSVNGSVGPFKHGDFSALSSGSCMLQDGTSKRFGRGYGVETTITEDVAGGDWYDITGDAAVLSPTGASHAIAITDWPGLLAYESDARVAGPTVHPTYGGLDIYMHAFGEWTTPNGYSNDAKPYSPAIGGI